MIDRDKTAGYRGSDQVGNQRRSLSPVPTDQLFHHPQHALKQTIVAAKDGRQSGSQVPCVARGIAEELRIELDMNCFHGVVKRHVARMPCRQKEQPSRLYVP
ncbi:hypothetical protein HY68_37565 [Streptomyces sp. AcH 505]|nr:hypothetical protein HY68_37565 [Streptomyces sp. AcH 505]